MMRWKYQIQIKDLLSEKDDYNICKKVMNDIYECIKDRECMADFGEWGVWMPQNFPSREKLGLMPAVQYLNEALDDLYDYCDDQKIWVQ